MVGREGDVAGQAGRGDIDCRHYFDAAPIRTFESAQKKVRSGDRSWASGAPSTRRSGTRPSTRRAACSGTPFVARHRLARDPGDHGDVVRKLDAVRLVHRPPVRRTTRSTWRPQTDHTTHSMIGRGVAIITTAPEHGRTCGPVSGRPPLGRARSVGSGASGRGCGAFAPGKAGSKGAQPYPFILVA